MSYDTYQPIYDAVRSQIRGCDIGAAVRDAIPTLDTWSIQNAFSSAAQDIASAMTRPCVLLRPTITIDGNQWGVLYGANLQDGIAGFGDTPEKAMLDFDRNYYNQIATPAAGRKDAEGARAKEDSARLEGLWSETTVELLNVREAISEYVAASMVNIPEQRVQDAWEALKRIVSGGIVEHGRSLLSQSLAGPLEIRGSPAPSRESTGGEVNPGAGMGSIPAVTPIAQPLAASGAGDGE